MRIEMTQRYLETAIRFMMNCFDGSVAKDGSPTILHSLGVLIRVSRAISCDCKKYYTACIAAVLHDVLEDCDNIMSNDIFKISNHEVADVVFLLTKVKGTRYRAYLNYLMNGVNSPLGEEHKIACLIKYHDMSDNLDRCKWLKDEQEKERMIKKYSNGIALFEEDDFIQKITSSINGG